MTAIAIELRYSGFPNPARMLTAAETDGFLGRFNDLAHSAISGSLCWEGCEDRSQFQVFFMGGSRGVYSLSHGLAVRRMTSNPVVALETRVDSAGTLVNYLSSLGLPRTLPEILAPQNADDPRCVDIPPPTYEPCACGGPSDFDLWASLETMLNNVCYNFALRDIWCAGGGGYPSGAPSDGDISKWNIALAKDGLVAVPDWHTIPKGFDPYDGWHVALALGPNGDGHFLRFDSDTDSWSHKYSTRLCQACDAAGKQIPRDQILAANLSCYCVKAFYWARSGLTIGGQ